MGFDKIFKSLIQYQYLDCVITFKTCLYLHYHKSLPKFQTSSKDF